MLRRNPQGFIKGQFARVSRIKQPAMRSAFNTPVAGISSLLKYHTASNQERDHRKCPPDSIFAPTNGDFSIAFNPNHSFMEIATPSLLEKSAFPDRVSGGMGLYILDKAFPACYQTGQPVYGFRMGHSQEQSRPIDSRSRGS